MNTEELINLFYNYVNYTNKKNGLDDQLFLINNLDRDATVQTLKENFFLIKDIVLNQIDHQVFLELMDSSNLHLYKEKINTLLNDKSFKSNLTILFAREIIQNNTTDIFKIFHNINICKSSNNRFYTINTRKKAIIILISLSTFNLNEYNIITCMALNYVDSFKNDKKLTNSYECCSINFYCKLRTIDSKIYLLNHICDFITTYDESSIPLNFKYITKNLENLYQFEDDFELRKLIRVKLENLNLFYNNFYK